jgi:GTP cyclohydrolase II
MAAAQEAIRNAGSGVVIWLDQEGKGNGHLALMQSIPFKRAGDSQGDSYVKAGFSADDRSYRAAAQILSDLGIRSIVLLANDSAKATDLASEGLAVAGTLGLNSPTARS